MEGPPTHKLRSGQGKLAQGLAFVSNRNRALERRRQSGNRTTPLANSNKNASWPCPAKRDNPTGTPSK